MNIETSGIGLFAVIAVMALMTLATRWGGILLISFIPIGPRTRRFVTAMSGSVLIAIVAPMAATGDAGLRLALLTTSIAMLLYGRPLPAIAAGILSAVLARQFS